MGIAVSWMLNFQSYCPCEAQLLAGLARLDKIGLATQGLGSTAYRNVKEK